MSNEFVIKPKKTYKNSTVVSARLPQEIIDKLEDIAQQTGRNRNELILMCIEYALDNIKIEQSEEK